MNRTAFITTEKKQDYPILIVDKKGIIGEELAKQLKDESLVVFVSEKLISPMDNVVHVPFLKKFPTIPDNTYSHMFLVDDDLSIAKNILESFLKKAKNDNSFFVLVTSLSYVTDAFVTNFLSSYENAKIAIFGDIFTSTYIYNSRTEINKFISQVKKEGKIKVPGNGTREVAPVYLEDVVLGVLETVFAAGGNKRIFYLFPKHKITLLTLAHIFQKIEPNIHIDFIKDQEATQENFILPLEGAYVLGESYDLNEKIKKINFENIVTAEVKIEKPVFRKKEENKLSYRILFFSFVFFLLLPILLTLTFSFIGLSSLYSVKNNIEKGNLSSSKTLALFALNSFNMAFNSSRVLHEEARIIGQEKMVQDLIDKVISGKEAASAAVSIAEASDKLKAVLTNTSANLSVDFYSATTDLKNALYIYNKEKEYKLIPPSILQKLSDLVSLTSSTIDFWPDILGFNGQKTYLVLFQNNMELRPGGGFIGSYAILTVNKGKVVGFNIYDVYDADGQLKAHVEPPYPIRRYLPSVHWYLRDSNFNVDFSKGAVASAVFLNSEMHQPVDGVIGVDLSFVKNLLSVVGPVSVSDYKETVTSDNFFQITQAHAEKDFFPGSTQKKDFLKSFYSSLQLKISENKNLPYLNLLQMVSSSIFEKHILFAFNKINEQAVFSLSGWSSALSDSRQQSDNSINDFMGINEANLGVDKVNYYITRSLSQKVSIAADGTVAEALTVAIKNTAQKTAWTGGHYKNYLRLILPLGTELSGIQINGQDQKIVPSITDPTIYEKKNFEPQTGLEVQKDTQGPNTIYGFLVTLQPQDLITIKANYVLSQKLNFARSDFSYDLRLFKQPGVDFYPYDFSINYPQNLKIVNSSSDIKVENDKAILSTQITRDRSITISLAQK